MNWWLISNKSCSKRCLHVRTWVIVRLWGTPKKANPFKWWASFYSWKKKYHMKKLSHENWPRIKKNSKLCKIYSIQSTIQSHIQVFGIKITRNNTSVQVDIPDSISTTLFWTLNRSIKVNRSTRIISVASCIIHTKYMQHHTLSTYLSRHHGRSLKDNSKVFEKCPIARAKTQIVSNTWNYIPFPSIACTTTAAYCIRNEYVVSLIGLYKWSFQVIWNNSK